MSSVSSILPEAPAHHFSGLRTELERQLNGIAVVLVYGTLFASCAAVFVVAAPYSWAMGRRRRPSGSAAG